MSDGSARVPRRGDVWEVRLDPVEGREIGKTRRVVLVGADGLSALELKIVVPALGRQRHHADKPWLVPIDERQPVFTKDVSVDCFQLRTLSIKRFERYCGRVTPAELDGLIDAIALCLDIPLVEE